MMGCASVYESSLGPEHQKTPDSLAAEMERDVTALAGQIGQRNCYRPEKLEQAAELIHQAFVRTGCDVRRQPVPVPAGPPYHCGAMTVNNVVAEKRGAKYPDEVVVVGAHYDTKVATPSWRGRKPVLKDMPGTPGANDNASGVAAVLALARMFAGTPTERTLHFVAFVNEEPPFFKTPTMGSRVYARSLTNHDSRRVVGMIAPETLGCYSAKPRTKRIRAAGVLGLPDRHDYVAFLSNCRSRSLVRTCAGVFRRHSPMELRTVAIPAVLPIVAWSDDWAFWQEGIPAFAVTDTAYLRHDDYHELNDTPENLDYGPMADVVWGLKHVIEALANPDRSGVER